MVAVADEEHAPLEMLQVLVCLQLQLKDIVRLNPQGIPTLLDFISDGYFLPSLVGESHVEHAGTVTVPVSELDLQALDI